MKNTLEVTQLLNAGFESLHKAHRGKSDGGAEEELLYTVTQKYEENIAHLQSQISTYQETLKTLREYILSLAESRKQAFVFPMLALAI